MAINTSMGGIQKPVASDLGILWYAEADEDIDVESITATSNLASLGLVSAGAITTDGLTLAENPTDPEVYKDWNGVTFDSTEAVSSPSITFALLEVLSEAAAKLVYANGAITATEDGELTAITGSTPPSNKFFVVDTRIKNRRVRKIYPNAAFASRGDEVVGNDGLAQWQVTYNLLADAENAVDRYAVYGATS